MSCVLPQSPSLRGNSPSFAVQPDTSTGSQAITKKETVHDADLVLVFPCLRNQGLSCCATATSSPGHTPGSEVPPLILVRDNLDQYLCAEMQQLIDATDWLRVLQRRNFTISTSVTGRFVNLGFQVLGSAGCLSCDRMPASLEVGRLHAADPYCRLTEYLWPLLEVLRKSFTAQRVKWGGIPSVCRFGISNGMGTVSKEGDREFCLNCAEAVWER